MFRAYFCTLNAKQSDGIQWHTLHHRQMVVVYGIRGIKLLQQTSTNPKILYIFNIFKTISKLKGTASGKIIGISLALIWRFQATAVQIIALMEGNGHVSSYRFSQRRCWQPYFFKASKTKFSSETKFSFPSSGFWLKSLVLVSEIISSFCLKGYASRSQRYVPARTINDSMIFNVFTEKTHTHIERERDRANLKYIRIFRV